MIPFQSHGCAVYRGNVEMATTFIDPSGDALPTNEQVALAKFLALAPTMFNLIEWTASEYEDDLTREDYEKFNKKAKEIISQVKALRLDN